MTVLGHTLTWGTHVEAGRTTDAKGWYTKFKTWWANRKAARQEAKRTRRAESKAPVRRPDCIGE